MAEGDVAGLAAPFNMAVASLQRLHFLRVDASEARRERNNNDWLTVLDAQFNEMLAMAALKTEEDESIELHRSQVYSVIKEHNGRTDCYRKNPTGKRVEVCGHSNQLFFALNLYERARIGIRRSKNEFRFRTIGRYPI